MDVVISVVLGAVVLVVLAVLVLSSLWVSDQFLDPVIGVLGRPVIWFSRRVTTARRQPAINKLPPGIFAAAADDAAVDRSPPEPHPTAAILGALTTSSPARDCLYREREHQYQ